MNRDKVDVLLRGRMLKQAVKTVYAPVRHKYGLRQIEIEILFTLAEFEDVSSSDIYRGQFLNKGQVSKALDELCRKAYVEMIPDENDHRYNRYRITETGSPAADEIRKAHRDLMGNLMDGVTAEEMRTLCMIAERVSANLERLTRESEDAADQGYLETV